MRRLLLAAFAAGGVVATAATANAGHPQTSSVTWPSVTPPGWYTNTYMHKWYFPYYAYYNFSDGPYANWAAGGGYAGYSYHGPAGMYYWPNLGDATPPTSETPKDPPPLTPQEMPKQKAGTISIRLPADATLRFNGVAASGSGAVRTFRTPALVPGRSYQYVLTAEVTRDGRTEQVSETVRVRAGETAAITLAPGAVTTASVK